MPAVKKAPKRALKKAPKKKTTKQPEFLKKKAQYKKPTSYLGSGTTIKFLGRYRRWDLYYKTGDKGIGARRLFAYVPESEDISNEESFVIAYLHDGQLMEPQDQKRPWVVEALRRIEILNE